MRRLGSPDRARDAAVFFQAGAVEASRFYRRRVRRPGVLTANDVFGEWRRIHAVGLSPEYARKMALLWEGEIAPRAIGDMRLREISSRPSLLVTGQDELVEEGLPPGRRREIWKLMRAVLRWGRRRHPDALTIEVAGLIDLPAYGRSRLAYAADPIGLEQIIEAVSRRPAHDPLPALRDAAFVAAMAGHSIQTLEGHYRHIIVRYLGRPPIDLVEECAEARRRVEEIPFLGG